MGAPELFLYTNNMQDNESDEPQLPQPMSDDPEGVARLMEENAGIVHDTSLERRNAPMEEVAAESARLILDKINLKRLREARYHDLCDLIKTIGIKNLNSDEIKEYRELEKEFKGENRDT